MEAWQLGTWSVATPILTSVISPFIVFVLGLWAWKWQYLGKKRVELAEDALVTFHEVSDAIRAIRNPMQSQGEGSTRIHSAGEEPMDRWRKDRAYIVEERHHSRKELFARFRTMRARYIAVFGEEEAKPFDEVTQCVDEILKAAYILARNDWLPKPEYNLPYKDAEVFWSLYSEQQAFLHDKGPEEDEVRRRINSAILKIQANTTREARRFNGYLHRYRTWVIAHMEESMKR